jgi:hypothetical protein
MLKKILIFVIILIALLGAYFVYNYFTQKTVKSPTIGEFYNDFKGPSGPPSIEGPTGPPPAR